MVFETVSSALLQYVVTNEFWLLGKYYAVH